MKKVAAVLLCLFALQAVAFTASLSGGKWFDNIVIVVLENQPYGKVMKDPNFAKYANMGRSLDNFYAVAHPSQPNYVAMIAGDPMGVTGDGNYNLQGTTLVDLFNKFGVTWKAYQEDYPGNCFAGDKGPYRRKHNPFISFDSIRNNATSCANIVSATQFDVDLFSGNLPAYSFYTPNMNNDGHDTGLSYAGLWLDKFLTPRLGSLMSQNRTLTVLTWDEDDYSEQNHIYTVLLGASIPKGGHDSSYYTFYSLMRTIEENWGLGTLGRHDSSATPIKMV